MCSIDAYHNDSHINYTEIIHECSNRSGTGISMEQAHKHSPPSYIKQTAQNTTPALSKTSLRAVSIWQLQISPGDKLWPKLSARHAQ